MTDRQITYDGQVPQTLDLLNTNKSTMIAIAKLTGDILGTSTIVTGLACVPTSPASMSVNVNPGQIYQNVVVDQNVYSDIAADTAHSIVKSGILMDAQNFAISAPSTAGYSQNYLIQATFLETDTNNIVLPYYNSSNPAQALNGPAGNGSQQPTRRAGQVSLQLVAGTAAATGTQTTPAVTAGYVGLWVITVANGQATITAGNISKFSGAPFFPGFARLDGSTPFTGVQQGVAPAKLDNSPNLATTAFANSTGSVVGMVRNGKMQVATAAATASFTADEVVVETVLGGAPLRLANFNQSVNLATTGAGGMDTGTAPVSGYVALYAIYNPTTAASALLATNATSGKQPEVYGGVNMPAGYTASALVSVWPTNASSQFITGTQIGRTVMRGIVTVLSTGTTQASPTSLSISSAVPPHASSMIGSCGAVPNSGQAVASAAVTLSIYPDAAGTGGSGVSAVAGGGNGANANVLVQLNTPQTVYYTSSINTGTANFTLGVVGYTF